MNAVRTDVPGYPGIGFTPNAAKTYSLVSPVIKQDIISIAPKRINRENLNGIFEYLSFYLGIYNVNTPLRLSHFFSQILNETGYLNSFEEDSFVYSAKALQTMFHNEFTPAMARKYGYGAGKSKRSISAQDQIQVADIAYGTKNGNQGGDDGYNYRGRGLIQITGKGNYLKYGGPLAVNNPGLVAKPFFAVETALNYWSMNNLNSIADEDDIIDMTQSVNGGGMVGLQERLEILISAKRVFGIPTDKDKEIGQICDISMKNLNKDKKERVKRYNDCVLSFHHIA